MTAIWPETKANRQHPLILVVEDEESLRYTIGYNLKQRGYEVRTAARGDDAVRLARETAPDLVILDLMLPGIDGIQVCRLLRRDSQVPIIMLTALAGEADRVTGLDAGADDYVTKPFGMKELLARVRAHLRRATLPSPEKAAPPSMRAGDLTVDTNRREVTKGGRPIHLRPREFELLLFFVRNAGRVLSRRQILAAVWGSNHMGTDRTVDVHVRWLREKIDDGAGADSKIKTVRGSGYRFEP